MKYSPETGFFGLMAGCILPSFKKFFRAGLVLGLLLALTGMRVEAQDDDYLAVYGVIDQADALNASGKTMKAHNQYIEAKRQLMTFQQNYPGWNAATVRFRMKYLDEKIAATKPAAMIPPSAAPSSTASQNVSNGASTVATDVPPAITSSDVKLLDAGSEPRKILRLHPAVGDKQTIKMNIKMAMEMSSAGNKMPAMKLPAMQMGMDITVTNISADGEITYAMVLGDATVATDTNTPAAMATAIKSALAGMRGITGTGSLSSQGQVKGVEMHVPADANPQLSQALGQMKDSLSSSSIVLPDVAVGAGAKWEFTTRLNSQGMNINLIIDYELVAIDGDVLTLRLTVKESAANQTVQSPATQGMKVKVTKLTGTGTGNSTFDLGHIMPTSSTLEEATATSIGAGQQAMDMKMDMDISVEAK